MIPLPWLRIARAAAPALIIALLIGWALVTRSMLATTRVQRDAAVADVADFRRAVTDATVTPGSDGTRALLSTPDAKAALAGAFRDRDDARAALTRVDRDTKAAKVRADASDAALARTQARNADLFAGAGEVIARLEAARPSGDAATDTAAIELDSKAAWEGWR